MDRVLLGKSLPESLSLLDKGIPPSSSGSVNSGTTSLVRDIWSREFCERTGDTAHRRNSEPAVRWASNTDCNYPRELGRTNEIDSLSRADKRERERERERVCDSDLWTSSHVELPAVWSDISNAMRGFKDHALHMLVLDEVLGLELPNFSRQLKLKPGIDDDRRMVIAMFNDVRFRAMVVTSKNTRRKNSQETRAQLEAMVLRTKPEANIWLHLSPRVAALGAYSFEHGPVMITKIHAYLLKDVNLAENAEKIAEFVNRMCQITLETFRTQEMKGQECFERTDSMLEGLGAG